MYGHLIMQLMHVDAQTISDTTYRQPVGLVPGASPLCTLKSVHFCWKTK